MSRSPAKLYVAYTTNTIPHTISVNLQQGVDIQDITTLRNDAVRFAEHLRDCVTPRVVYVAWGLRAQGGGQLWSEGFSAPYVGNLTPPLGAVQWNSNTVRIEGKAAGITVGGDAGRTSFELFVSDSVLMEPGRQGLDMTTLPQWDALRDWINLSTRLFCDLFGQKADVANQAPLQFNAHAQRKHGN